MKRACGSLESSVYSLLQSDVAKYLSKRGQGSGAVDLFRIQYLLDSLLKKHVAGGTEKQRVESATASWYEAEKLCFMTNLRLDDASFTKSSFVHEVQRFVLDIIGAEPNHELLAELCKWGPGATSDLRRSEARLGIKTTGAITVTSRALRWLSASPYMDEHWADALGENCFRVVRGNRCVMVAKTSKTHRTIAAEPTGNSFLQQGVGRYFKARLKKFGIDLFDQTVNQDLAKHAFAWKLATIDLSMASDTMCRSLVDLLLPPKWSLFLNDLRSTHSRFGGKWIRLEKFSSMGNAFTFELESLLFFSLLRVACGPCVWVFGDDIVVLQDQAQDAIRCLNLFGFKVNEEKSFTGGPFYESCGKHYYEGFDVTPVYQKKLVTDRFERIRFHNRLWRWGFRSGLLPLVSSSLRMIRDEDGGNSPRQPVWFEGDVGFIEADFNPVPNRKYPMCVEVPVYRKMTDTESQGCYAFKLRCPSLTSNGHPKGQPYYVKKTQRTIRHRPFIRH